MQLRHRMRHAAPAAEVRAMLLDPAYRREVGAAQHVVSLDVEVGEGADGTTVTCDQRQRTGDLPAVARKIVGETTRAVVTEIWTSPTAAELTIEAPGAPTTARGTITLLEADGVTTREIELDLRVKVPVVGGKLEKIMAEQVTEGYRLEEPVAQAWLSR